MLFNATTDEIRQAFVEANFDQPVTEIEDLFDAWLEEKTNEKMHLAWVEGATSIWIRPDLSIIQVINRNPYRSREDQE